MHVSMVYCNLLRFFQLGFLENILQLLTSLAADSPISCFPCPFHCCYL